MRTALEGLGLGLQGLGAEMRAGFARTDRHFEMMQVQHQEFREEVHDQLSAVDDRLDRLETRVAAVESELRTFRDWVAVQLAELRAWIRTLTTRIEGL